MTQKIKSLSLKLEKAEDTGAELNSKLEELNTKSEVLNLELSKIKREIEIENLKLSLAALRKVGVEFVGLGLRVTDIDSEQSTIEEELKNLESSLDKQKQGNKFDAKFHALNIKKAELESLNKLKLESAELLVTEVDKLDKKSVSLEYQLSKMRKRLENFDSVAINLLREIDDVDFDISKTSNEILELKSHDSSLDAERRDVNVQIFKLNTKLLKSDVRSMEMMKKRDGLLAKSAEMFKKSEMLKSESGEWKRRAVEMKSLFRKMRREASAFDSQALILEHRAEDLDLESVVLEDTIVKNLELADDSVREQAKAADKLKQQSNSLLGKANSLKLKSAELREKSNNLGLKFPRLESLADALDSESLQCHKKGQVLRLEATKASKIFEKLKAQESLELTTIADLQLLALEKQRLKLSNAYKGLQVKLTEKDKALKSLCEKSFRLRKRLESLKISEELEKLELEFFKKDKDLKALVGYALTLNQNANQIDKDKKLFEIGKKQKIFLKSFNFDKFIEQDAYSCLHLKLGYNAVQDMHLNVVLYYFLKWQLESQLGEGFSNILDNLD